MDNSIIIPIYPQSQPNDFLLYENTQKAFKCLKSKRNLMISGVITLITILSLLTLFLLFRHSSATKTQSNQFLASIGTFIILQGYQIERNDQGELSIDGVFIHLIETLIIRDESLTSFDTTYFYSLKNLTIDSNVKFDTLVINGSKLAQFTYSSPELQRLIFINNTRLTRFYSCNLPSLIYLNVYLTDITIWEYNNLSNLQNFELISSNVKIIPLFNGNLRSIIVNDCGDLTLNDTFVFYENIQKIQFYQTRLQDRVELADMVHFVSIKIVNCSLYKGFTVKMVRLQSFIIQNCSYIADIILENVIIWNQFNPSIKQIERIWIKNDSNIREFLIQTENLQMVILEGNIKKIQPNIPGLTTIYLSNNEMNETQFSQIRATNMTELIIRSCPKLKLIKNTFPFLKRLYLINQTDTDLSTIDLSNLEFLSISGGKHDHINTSLFPKLLLIEISDECRCQLVSIQNPVQKFTLEEISQPMDILLNSTQIKYIDIRQSNLKPIQNSQFNKLKQLRIVQSKNLCIRNNSFSEKFQKLTISSVEQELIFENNNFAVHTNSSVVLRYIKNYAKLKQNLSYFSEVQISRASLEDFQSTIDYLTNVKQIDVSGNNFKSIKEVFDQQITRLVLMSSNHLTEFRGNTFTNLKYLILADCGNLDVFKNNTLPQLLMLSVRKSTQLNGATILEEFKNWKNQGTNLKFLHINYGQFADIREEILKIFPHVEFIEN